MEAKKRFKEVREHYGLSMTDFGAAIGLSASGISAIEYGTRAMGEKHIKLICAAFPAVSEQWLRTGEGDMFVQRAETDQAVVDQITKAYDGSPTFRALMTAYLKLDEPRRRIFEEVVVGFSAAVSEANASHTPIPDAETYIRERAIPIPEQDAQ